MRQRSSCIVIQTRCQRLKRAILRSDFPRDAAVLGALSLPRDVRVAARKAYEKFSENPAHPSLRLEWLRSDGRAWSVRITRDCRAVAFERGMGLALDWRSSGIRSQVSGIEGWHDAAPRIRRYFGVGAALPTAEARERSDYSSIAPLIFRRCSRKV
jgi:hypothetical protein